VRPRRILIVGALLFAAVLVQTALLGRFALLGAKPELLTLIVVSVAMLDGPVTGALAGFAAGLLLDAQTSLPDGLSALVLAATGATVGRIRLLIQRPSAWVPAASVGAATLASMSVYAVLALLFGAPTGSALRTIARILLAAVYGAALTPLIYPGLQRLLIERPRTVIGSVVRR
jgi:rod shape-determining protein MreD